MWSFVEPMRSFMEQVLCGADVVRYRLINPLIIKTNVVFLPRPTAVLSRPAAVYSELSINL